VQAVEHTSVLLKPFLQNCDVKVVSQKLEQKLNSLKKMIPAKSTLVFFLGGIIHNRLPELLMVNDGVVKWMIDQKLIKSYPSPLSYVNWSARILLEMPNETIRVGLKDSGSEMTQKVEKHPTHTNLTFPGALIPGSGQVEAMIYLFENLGRK
jgi:hypothetical protein